MPRIKRIVPTRFTTVNNDFLRDTSLSLAARGLLITMLSLPDGWNMSGRGLAAILPDGRDKVFSTLKTLEQKGYLKREKIRENGHFVDVEYQFCDSPIFTPTELNTTRKGKTPKKAKIVKSSAKNDDNNNSIFSYLMPRQEKKADVLKNLSVLVNDELEAYVSKVVLEKEKCVSKLHIPETYFDIIAKVYVDVCVVSPDKQQELATFTAYDVVAICEEEKKKKSYKLQDIAREYFIKGKAIFEFE